MLGKQKTSKNVHLMKTLFFVTMILGAFVICPPVYGKDDLDQKVNEARKELKRDSKNPLLYEKLGWAFLERYMDSGNKSDGVRAVNVFKRFVKLDNGEARAWYGLGVAYYKTGRINKSGENFKKAISIDENLFQGQVAMGNYYLNKGQFREAAGHYQKAGKIQPKNQYVYTNLAQLYLTMGNYEKSLSFAEKALNIDPDNVHTNLVKAGVYRFQGKNDQANEILTQVLDDNSDNTDAILQLAQNYFDMGDYKKAKSSVVNYNTLDETSGNGFELLGLIYKRTGRIEKMKGNIKVAETLYYQKVVDGAVENYGALSWLNSEYNLDKTKALKYAQKYLILKETAEAYKIMAWAWFKNRDYDKALLACKKALKINPRLSEHWYRMGMIQKAKNNLILAKRAFQKALTMGAKTYHEEVKAELFKLK
ncbi:MAG: tetratricopeptide repeat protein [Nitrospinales bacterium]